jgi:hypothetical protein
VFGRPARVGDLETALSIDPFSFGGELVGRSKALAAYAQLVRTERMFSTVVEMPLADGGRQMIGFGGALFVSDAFFQEEIGDPKPGLNSRIIASMVRKKPVVLTHDEVRRDNTTGGLNVVITHAAWVPNMLNAVQTNAFESVLSYAFFQLMRGYRLRRFFREAGSAEAIAHVKSQRVFAQMVTFDRFHAAHPDSRWNHDRALFVAEREHCLSLPGSVASMLFAYSEPVMRLRDTDQELLLAALDGLTDGELADVLDLKLPALKKRWASLFDRVGRVRPDLVPQSDRETPARGPQKRHRLLAYLREHPEELRPRSAKPFRRFR